MAMGEWLSVTSARELSQQQIAVEADELARMPEEEEEELALIYEAKGLEETQARALAKSLMANRETALDTLARIFPERTIVAVPALDIVAGGGGIHCITQQQPAAGRDA